MRKRVTAGLLLVLALGALAGCNTMAGLGKDIGHLGNKIEQKARD